ncbi:hypothetical protein C8R44DRAFT_873746 [Mycena epipterygia]|nr:hypothetical protein C8R44DRAFT_873746 [Mycena epipterygia]
MSDYVPYIDPLLPSSQAGSDYEQLESQHQEIECTEKRRMYSAAAVEDESLPAAVEDESSARTPRASAVTSAEKTSVTYRPRGPLDWQTTSQEFVDALLSTQLADQEDCRKGCNVIDSQTTSQDFAGLLFIDDRQLYMVNVTATIHVGNTSEAPEPILGMRSHCVQGADTHSTAYPEIAGGAG